MTNCKICGNPVQSGVVVHAGCLNGLPKWISVEERLPPKNTCVLVVADGQVGNNISLVHCYQLAIWSGKEGWILDEFPEAEDILVSYWMPLPPEP